MAGHDVSPGDASELQRVVNQVLTPFHPEFRHVDEHPVVMLSALEAALSAVPVVPFQNGDPRFVQLMSELEAQLMSEAATDGLFNLDLPELLPASQGRAASMDTPAPPLLPAASVGNNGGGVEETPIENALGGSAISGSRGRSDRVHRRPKAERPSPITAGAKGSRCGTGVRAPRRASSSSGTVPGQGREVPIQPERQRRVTMAELFATLRQILPPLRTSSATDKSAVVKATVDYIATLEAEIERLQAIASRTSGVASGGRLICFDHTGDANALTAVTTVPAPGSDASTLASFLGANVTVQVCAQNCFVTVSSPCSVRLFSLLLQIVVVIFRHGLETLLVTAADRHNVVVFNIICQGSEPANLMTNTLHIALQSVVDYFIRSLSCN